ncbi:C4-dicarboxylate TRAP transporter substrate-binding protein [Marinobacter sp. X15-166B]|uniref:C4-dicarboxylate TRAP transporter substrate-binding protein n=1 Tax=Marinobacter sp. X15-166B TaxID=1897620 RepID=UPI00085BEC29|nr:C4-dicarboxylate TRAP transporter substrate-binding protein [Marinobacter sp. X15-166B]OEY66045.1 C4-dicarboxylate ABC transporter substrate-binding protein [Marinobacter sp. X15-166B]
MRKTVFSAVSLLAFATATQATNYQATTWLEPSHVLTEYAYVPYLEAIKSATDGRVDFELYTSGALVPAKTTLSGVGDGVAQLGLVAAAYTPSALPLSGLINDLAFTATDPMATALAFTELAMTNPRFQSEYAQHNTVTLGAYSTPVYLAACMSDVVSTNDIRGIKVRTAGTAQNEWISSLGAVPVSVPSTDIYSGLERGSIECTLGDATNLENGPKLGEVARSLTLLDQGTSLGMTYVYNQDFWRDIGPDNRRLILDVTARAIAVKQINYEAEVNDSLAKTRARGTRFNEPDQSLVDALAEFRANIVETYPKRTEVERRIPDPTDVAQEYLKLMEKWQGLLVDIDRSNVDALTKLIHDEIFVQIDEKTYGI